MDKSVDLKRSHVVLLFLILLGWGLRVYRLDAQELRGDEAFSWNYVVPEVGVTDLVKRIVVEGDPQPPIHYFLLQRWVGIFGDSEWSMRSLSAFLSLMLIPLVYKLGIRAKSHQAGLVAAALTTIHPFQIWLAQDVRNMYQIALILGLASTLLLSGLLRGKRGHWFVYILCSSLAIYSHYYALFGLMAHCAYVALSPWSRKGVRVWMRWLSAGVAIVLLVLPWAMVILPVYAQGQLADPTYISPGRYLSVAGASFAVGPTISSDVGMLAGYIWALLCVVGVYYAWRSSRFSWVALLIAWPIIALLGIYVVTFRRATFNTFYFMMAFPAVYVLLTCGWLALTKMKRVGRIVSGIVAILGLFTFWLALGNYYFDPDWSKNRGMRQIAKIIDAEGRAGDIFIANFPDPAQDYYLRHINMPRQMLPVQPGSSVAEIEVMLEYISVQYDRIWFVPIRAFEWDHDSKVRSHLDQTLILESEHKLPKLELLSYVTDPTLAHGYHSLNASFAGGPDLVGVQITANGVPSINELVSGDLLRVSLVWETKSLIPKDYTVFVHALDAEGRPVAQHDGVPQDAVRPTSTWGIGEVVLDTHEFELPRLLVDDEITIAVGMYLLQTGDRLILSDGSEYFEVAELTVVDKS